MKTDNTLMEFHVHGGEGLGHDENKAPSNI